MLDTCANGVWLRFIRPGKPISNAYGELNGKFRERLNERWFVRRDKDRD